MKAKDESDYKFIDTNNNNYEYNFIKYKVEMTLSSFSINDGSTQIYIRLADFIEILNHYVLLSDKKNKTPIKHIKKFKNKILLNNSSTSFTRSNCTI